MKQIRILSLIFATLIFVFSAGACSDIKEYIDNRKEKPEPRPELYGSDVIAYGNSKREKVIADLIMPRMEDEAAKPLLEKVEVTFDPAAESGNVYRFHVSNKNPGHFYNGVVQIKGVSEEFLVNVRMLAPEASEQFDLVLSEDPAGYQYSVDGGFYEQKAEVTITHKFRLSFDGLEEGETFIIVDAEAVDKQMAADFAEYFYKMNTVYNSGEYNKYYMVAEGFFNPRKRDSEFTIIVDIATGRISVCDAKGNPTMEQIA